MVHPNSVKSRWEKRKIKINKKSVFSLFVSWRYGQVVKRYRFSGLLRWSPENFIKIGACLRKFFLFSQNRIFSTSPKNEKLSPKYIENSQNCAHFERKFTRIGFGLPEIFTKQSFSPSKNKFRKFFVNNFLSPFQILNWSAETGLILKIELGYVG